MNKKLTLKHAEICHADISRKPPYRIIASLFFYAL